MIAAIKSDSPEAAALLGDIRAVFGLSENELADLFGVRRQSLDGWRKHGIPLVRLASVERVAELARLLHREIIPTRIPQIVRTKDAWLGDRTILHVLAHDGVDPIYAYLHRLFAYA